MDNQIKDKIQKLIDSSPEGKSAYNDLLELGFVETKYKGI